MCCISGIVIPVVVGSNPIGHPIYIKQKTRKQQVFLLAELFSFLRLFGPNKPAR